MRTRLLAFLLCTATGLLLLGTPALADGHLDDLERRLDRLEKHIDRLADHLHAAHGAHADKATCDKQGGCDEGKRGKRCDQGGCDKGCCGTCGGDKARCSKGGCDKRGGKGDGGKRCDKQATCDKGGCDKKATCDKGGCDKKATCDKGCCGTCGGDKARCSKGGCDKRGGKGDGGKHCDKQATCDKGGCDKRATCDKGGCDKAERTMAPRVAATPARPAPIFRTVRTDVGRVAVARGLAPGSGPVAAQIERYEEMIRDAETDAAVAYFLTRIETLRKQAAR